LPKQKRYRVDYIDEDGYEPYYGVYDTLLNQYIDAWKYKVDAVAHAKKLNRES
jgi:hypothetical protein